MNKYIIVNNNKRDWLMPVLVIVIVVSVIMTMLLFFIPPNNNTTVNNQLSASQHGSQSAETVITSLVKNSWTDTVEKVYSSVVQIHYYDETGSGAFGTGVRINENYILTNEHVLSDASIGDEVDILVNDYMFKKGLYVGKDKTNDLALVKIAEDLPEVSIAKLGDSNNISLGEEVMVIGNPVGLNQSITIGFVSALNRSIETEYENLSTDDNNSIFDNEIVSTNAIQLDINTNSGNSGSPVFNINGEVIAIVFSATSRLNNDDYITGVTFAIPINTFKERFEKLTSSEDIGKTNLGVKGKRVRVGTTPNIIGVQVMELENNGLAHRSGVQTLDVITKINDVEITSVKQLSSEVNKYSLGESIVMTVLRDGETVELSISL